METSHLISWPWNTRVNDICIIYGYVTCGVIGVLEN